MGKLEEKFVLYKFLNCFLLKLYIRDFFLKFVWVSNIKIVRKVVWRIVDFKNY